MQWFIRLLGLAALVIGVLQIVRSINYPKILSKWSLSESKVNVLVWIARIGGILGIVVGIWLIFFVEV